MLPNIVHWFTMEKFRSVHLGNTERKNPNLCPSTGDLTLPGFGQGLSCPLVY